MKDFNQGALAEGTAKGTLEEILRIAWDRGRSAAARSDLVSQGQALAYYDILSNGKFDAEINGLRPFEDKELEAADPDEILNPPGKPV